MFVADGGECLVAQSYAKNLGLYGERVGALSIVSLWNIYIILVYFSGRSSPLCMLVMSFKWLKIIRILNLLECLRRFSAEMISLLLLCLQLQRIKHFFIVKSLLKVCFDWI